MNKINVTHIHRHCTKHMATKIINLIRSRISMPVYVSYANVIRVNGTHHYTKIGMGHVDVREAIEVVVELSKNPPKMSKNFDYQDYIDILERVLEDRVEYGDMIPETSDTFKKLYHDSQYVPQKKYKKDGTKCTADKKARQKEFLNKFSETKIKWS